MPKYGNLLSYVRPTFLLMYMEDAMSSTTAVSTPQDQVDQLMRQTAEEANIELQ